MSYRVDEKELERRLKEKHPDEDFSVVWVSYGKDAKVEIVCNSCKRHIIAYKGDIQKNSRKFICKKCNTLREDTRENREKIKEIFSKNKITEYEFFMAEQKNKIRADKVRYLCPLCNRISERWVSNFIRNNQDKICTHCESNFNKDTVDYKREIASLYGEKFTLLSDYQNVATSIKVRCNDCGFIRNVKPVNLLRNGYCPKCGAIKSKGEKKIATYLKEKGFSFETEKYFKEFNIGLHYYDFVLSDEKIIIEYQGVQHYVFNPFFHKTQENFNYCCQKDIQKEKAAIKNGYSFLVIPYTELDNIDLILNTFLVQRLS